MMSNRDTMPAMMAWRTEPMPLTMAIRQAPMVWKMDLICGEEKELVKVRFVRGRVEIE